MISWLISPLPIWAKIVIWVVLVVAIATVCVLWVFPLVQPFLLPATDSTVGGG